MCITASRNPNDFLKANGQGLQTDVIILDFSKTLDTVPHKELLHKLKHNGINGTVTSFLTKRYMRVVVEMNTLNLST